MTKISVVIPIYNSAKHLGKTFKSLAEQTFKDFEVICINDCSTDNSSEYIEEFAKKDLKIKIINNSENIGSALTRNIGIDNAKGEYIYFLDADDYIEKNYLESMVQKIEQENCDIVLNLSINNETGTNSIEYKHPSMPKINPNGEYLDKITTIHDAPCFIWARIYKKTFLNKYNLRFIDTHADDVVFNTITSIFTPNTFVFYGGKYHYTNNDSGMTNSVNKLGTKDLEHIKAHSIIYDYLKEHNKLDERLKLFRVYPFIKVDTEEKFDFYKKFFEKIKIDFQRNENIYNEMERYFAYSLLNSSCYDDYLQRYNKIVTIGFLRSKK